MKTGKENKLISYRLIICMTFHSTESGLGSDIFDVGAGELGRHSSTMERVSCP